MPVFNVEFTKTFVVAVHARSRAEAERAACAIDADELDDWGRDSDADWDVSVSGPCSGAGHVDQAVVDGRWQHMHDAREAGYDPDAADEQAERERREADLLARNLPLPGLETK